MATNEILAIAKDVAANVTAQATYAANAALIANGFTSGVVPSNNFNKALRQSSFVAAMIGKFTADAGGVDVVDDGDVPALVTKFKGGLRLGIDDPVFTTKTTSPRFIPSGSTVATNGMYLPASNVVGFSANSVEQMRYGNGIFQWGINSRTENFSVYKNGGNVGDTVANFSGCVNTYLVTGSAGNAAVCALNVAANIGNGRSINAGGTIQASGADYAEYMRKAPGCGVIAKGQLVGIDANGEVTDKFADAHHFMVKSTTPNLVGGDTWAAHLTRPLDPVPFDGELCDADTYEAEVMGPYRAAMDEFEAALEAARQTVDRIAFCGQVPVNVVGATVRDYIVPEQDGDGVKGVAVSAPSFEQYRNTVGKVIAIEADGRAKIIVKAI